MGVIETTIDSIYVICPILTVSWNGTMNLRTLKHITPWWAKMAGHLLVSNLPGGYKLWHRLGVLQHGRMEDPSYAYGVFVKHFERVREKLPCTFTALELGPGDSISSAIIATTLGATRYYLVDDGKFAREDVAHYQGMARYLAQKGLRPPSLEHARTFEDVLASCNTTYGEQGIASLRKIPTGSLDFIWSHGVLPNIRREQFLAYMHELRRILKPSGYSSHVVPLNDQFVGGLNHLMVPTVVWESAAMAKCGPYTNRLRYSEMLDLIEQAGFETYVVGIQKWPELPTPRWKLISQFREMSDDELCVLTFEVVLKPIPLRLLDSSGWGSTDLLSETKLQACQVASSAQPPRSRQENG